MNARTRVAGLVVLAGLLSACGNASITDSHSTARHGAGFSATTDGAIAQAQQRLRAQPDDWRAVDLLAGAYLQKVREVGDPTYYPKVEALLNRALSHDPADTEATTLMGALALARHQFAAALEWGTRALAVDPHDARALGIVGDGQIELGRYPDGVATFQRMVNQRPDLSSYARVSYARELYGDVDGAITAMTQAVEAGGPVPENSAYTRVLLGNLYFNAGRLAEAEQQYRQAAYEDPGYPYALAGLARVEAGHQRYGAAIALFQRAVAVYPLPDFVIGLGDVFAASGNAKRAGEAYDLAAAEQQLYQANGVDLDAELALFDADHHRDLPNALAAARRAMADRPSLRTSDILAWTLYQVGNDHAALDASRQAHRLGTRDALLYFHTGMIEARLGMTSAAVTDLEQALSINPYFSVIWTPVARQTLAQLGSLM